MVVLFPPIRNHHDTVAVLVNTNFFAQINDFELKSLDHLDISGRVFFYDAFIDGMCQNHQIQKEDPPVINKQNEQLLKFHFDIIRIFL